MNRYYKTLLLTLPLAATLIGCSRETQSEATVQAYNRWNGARAALVLGVGEEQFRAGDLENAGASAREALALSPELTGAHILMARVHIERGRYLEAQGCLDTAEQLQAENPQIAYLSGVVHEKRGEYVAALTAYEKARALDGENGAYVMASAEVLVALDRPVEALELIEGKMQNLDRTYGLSIAAGKLALMVGEPDRAVEHFCAARAMSEQLDEEVLAGLCQAYHRAGRYRESVYALNELRTMDDYEQRSWVHTMLGHAYLGQDQPRDARACFERATELEPRRSRHWVDLATAAMACNDPQRTILSAREALRLQRGDIDATVLLAAALLKADRPSEAHQILAEATAANPDHQTLKILMARSLSMLGRRDEARQWYTDALSAAQPGPLAERLAQSNTGSDHR